MLRTEQGLQTASGEKRVLTFRVSWLRAYATIALGSFVLMLLSHNLPPRRLPNVSDLSLMLVILAAELPITILLSFCYPTRMSAESLRGFNFWGLPCVMTWEEIVSATPSRPLGLPYLIVRSHRSPNALWLPLFVADKQDFREALQQFAPPSSPLRR